MSKLSWGTFPVVQWLRLCTANAGGAGSIPGWGTRVPHATVMYRTVLWTLWERERVGRFGRMALKHVYYHV